MKKTTLTILVAAALALTACGRSATYDRTTVTSGYKVDYPGGFTGYTLINVWTDPVTGCESYVTDEGFLSPRLNPDGSQRCSAPAP